MRPSTIFLAIPLLTLAVHAPAVADQREDLEATMTVVDDPAEMDDEIRRLQRPDDSDVEEQAPDTGEAADEPGEEPDDGFELDDVYNDDEMVNEDDFEEGEDIDDDAYDEDTP